MSRFCGCRKKTHDEDVEHEFLPTAREDTPPTPPSHPPLYTGFPQPDHEQGPEWEVEPGVSFLDDSLARHSLQFEVSNSQRASNTSDGDWLCVDPNSSGGTPTTRPASNTTAAAPGVPTDPFLSSSLQDVDRDSQTRMARSFSSERLSVVFPSVAPEIIEAVVDSNDGDFESALDQMLEISATPRSSNQAPMIGDLNDVPGLASLSEDIMWTILRELTATELAHVAVTSVCLAILVNSGQQSGQIPPRVPQTMSHVAFSGPRGRAMVSALTTVLITVINARSGQLLSVASGSIVRGSNRACYVLTSEHNLRSRKGSFDATANPADTHILVAVNDSVARAPKHRFRAELHPSCVDKKLDLCVLHLVEVVSTTPERGVLEHSQESGNKRLVKALSVQSDSALGPIYGVLHAAEIGVVDTVGLGATLMVFGFPISGEESITMSEASASGFITDGDHSSWIKLHGNLDNGFSGGAVVLEATGELVGIVSHSRGHVDFARPAALALRLLEQAVKVHAHLNMY